MSRVNFPAAPETRQLVNAESLEWLPHGAYLVNTARGGVVDAAALTSGRLAGAGIDVLTQEPPSPDAPLLVAWRELTHPACPCETSSPAGEMGRRFFVPLLRGGYRSVAAVRSVTFPNSLPTVSDHMPKVSTRGRQVREPPPVAAHDEPQA